MSTNVAALIEAGLSLEPDERAIVANTLLDSLHEQDESEQRSHEDAWSAEVDKRLEDVLSGKVDLVDADEHFERLRAELSNQRG